MDWKRGNAIKEQNVDSKPLNLKNIKYRISYIVNRDLEEFKTQTKLDENNKFGKWIIK